MTHQNPAPTPEKREPLTQPTTNRANQPTTRRVTNLPLHSSQPLKMSTRVYIGGLHFDTNDRDIEDFLGKYGKIREVILKKGFGFVEFDDNRDAEDAVYDLNGKRLLGQRVTVEFARQNQRNQQSTRGRGRGGGNRGDFNPRYGQSSRSKYRLIVENLSSQVSWQDLKDYMRQAGDVTYGDAHKKRRNEGVVDFATKADMKNAIKKFDNSELKGRRMKLVEARRSRSRSRSVSRSRSRGRSFSRSRSRSVVRSRSGSRGRRSRSGDNKRSEDVDFSDRKFDESEMKDRRSVSRSPTRSRSRSVSPARKDDARYPNESAEN
uniref:RRM domain-containing protein n=1 Tax=Strigamia maritima TaxID=126957 RepID=T1IYE3_STRMM